MANFPLGFLFHALLITATAVTAAPQLPAATEAQPQAAAALDDLGLQQLYNIIDSLIGSGDFGNWANILSTTDPSMFPLSATLFIPRDSAFTSSADGLRAAPDPPLVDPLLFSYHIVPQRLSFSDLMLFPINSRLPTLLIDKSLLITNNSRSNFTLNGSHLTHPDLYSTSSVSVHGIEEVLDFTTRSKPEPSINAHPRPQSPSPTETQEDSPPTTNGLEEAPPALTIDGTAASGESQSDVFSAGFLPVLCSVLGLINVLGHRIQRSAR